MRPLRISDDGPAPYEQVREQLRARIERGTMLPCDRLPTVRGLAADLHLAPNTVARAYRELEVGGWLVGRGRAGTFVADRLPETPDDGATALAAAADAYLRRARQLGFGRPAARAMLDRV
ncbi:MAG TPA: GntR family transcriptional regulator [Actinomycetota bacterium]|nr:GntR family transcriptional regulator [Actinomycetota bacterium]